MKRPSYKVILFIFDFILIRLSFSFAMQMRGVSFVHGAHWNSYFSSLEFFSFFLLSLFVTLIFQAKNLYRTHIVLSNIRQAILIFISIGYSVVGLAVLAFFFRSPWIVDSRLAVVYFAASSFSLVLIFRLFVFQPLYISLNRSKLRDRRVAIIGTSIAAKSFAVEMSMGNIYGFNLVGFINGAAKGDHVYDKYSILGGMDEIPKVVKEYSINELIVAVSDVPYKQLMHILDQCKQTPAHINVASSLFEIVHKKVPVDSYFDLPVAPMGSQKNNNGLLAIKRIVDMLGAIVGIILLSPLFLIIALGIKLTSKGPIIYKQTRIGKNGKPFTFYKFRSMVVGSDESEVDGNNSPNGEFKFRIGRNKIVDEKKLTPIGRILRITSIDELPQLFNVIKGDMSLVGPRPCLPVEYKAYDEWHKRRFSVTPGCTGLWQVSSRAEGGLDEMVVLDLYYIANMSPLLDIQLILKTIPVMLFGRGAK